MTHAAQVSLVVLRLAHSRPRPVNGLDQSQLQPSSRFHSLYQPRGHSWGLGGGR
jgi:hypothetical protein